MPKLYLVGLGLWGIDDISVRALRALQGVEMIYLESYTSYFYNSLDTIRDLIQQRVIPVGRREIEEEDVLINSAKEKDTAFLVVGDPLSATTHAELFLRAREQGIEVVVMHNTSVVNAVANTGLEIYKFGKTASLVYPRKNWFPKTSYQVIKDNYHAKAHTLVLLDIVTTQKEIDMLDYTKGGIDEYNKKYNNSSQVKTFDGNPMVMMSPNEALKLLLHIESEENQHLYDENSKVFVCSQLATRDERISYGQIKDLLDVKFGLGPNCIVIPADLHFIEKDFAQVFEHKKIE